MQKVFKTLQRLPIMPSSKPCNITISHQKKFIWFRVAKVGTRTILHHLKESNVYLDVEHASMVYYPKSLLKHYFKFAFVRNPWERLTSCWINKVVKQNFYRFKPDQLVAMQDFGNFISFIETLDIEKCDRHLQLQSALIDLNEINYLGRMETFEQDLSNIFRTLELPLGIIEKKNLSLYKTPYIDLYNQELADRVAEIYRKDIQIFGYHFG